ncbi:MAG: multiheme c-type cytochrome [Desulfatibacillaceae bacterium]
MRHAFRLLVTLLIFAPAPSALGADAPVSMNTEECLACHESLHSGIVADWRRSRHASTTPKEAMKVPGLSSRFSADSVPEEYAEVSVGCYECHGMRPRAHDDTFDHEGYDIHVVVSPDDCATCHVEEREQFSRNLMSHARKNLLDNRLYHDLRHAVNGIPEYDTEKGLKIRTAGVETERESCIYCHGSDISVKGFITRDTDLGEMEFVQLDGWPNQGVGRENPDGSRGACSACHTRHEFSIETARKPHTCKECHVGPDVPAYKVYMASKHGNIYSSRKQEWNFEQVPWVMGENFTAPTCATCHISLLVNNDGDTVVERTHEMANRLSWRLFGLIYAHPHPIEPDTSIIINDQGQPLPTSFDGGFARSFLLNESQREERLRTMQAVCLNCHASAWVNGHFERFHNTIETTNDSVLAATKIMSDIWTEGYATGLAQGGNPFDEEIERRWGDIWLFYANTVRFASAMAGGGDYGTFADGRYQLSKAVQDLFSWLELRRDLTLAGTAASMANQPEGYTPATDANGDSGSQTAPSGAAADYTDATAGSEPGKAYTPATTSAEPGDAYTPATAGSEPGEAYTPATTSAEPGDAYTDTGQDQQ